MAQALKKSTYGLGPKIVLLHGWGLNSGVWKTIVDQLSVDFEVTTVDLPGFGLNHDVMPHEYTLDTISKMIVEAVDGPAIFIGWSLGGLIASKIAIEYSTSCLGLVTVASSPCFKQGDNWPGIKPAFLQAFYHQLSKDIEQTLKSFLKIQAMGSPHIRKDLKIIQALIMAYPLPNERALKSGLDLLDTSDLRPDVGRIIMPFLRVYGKLDSLVPKITAEKVSHLVSHSEQITFEKSSHAPFISESEEFVHHLVKWLTKTVAEVAAK